MAGLAGHVLVDGGAVAPCIIATLLAPEPTDTIPVPKSWNKRLLHLCAISLVAIMPGYFASYRAV